MNPVSKILKEKSINHRVFLHTGEIHSLAQAAFERGQMPEQVVRSIVFRLGEGEFVMVLVAGPAQISWQKLRQYLSQSRLTMANEKEVLNATGYLPGTVSPIVATDPIRVLVDESILAVEELSIGSGVRGEAIILKSSDLLKALGTFEIGIFVNS